MKIPLSKPYLDKEEEKVAVKTLKSGWLIHGPANDEFEKKFAEFIGVKHAVTLNSCASALQLAVEAKNIRGEVILPAFTHMASANAIVRAGATPVFADVDFDNCILNSKSAEAMITSKTEAIMVVHFAGGTANLDVFKKLCDKYHLVLIEDSAENAGGKWKNKMSGSVGIGCFSFFPTKNMTTAEGGMLTTNDEKVAERARIIAGHGVAGNFLTREKTKKFWVREAILPGLNFRMSNVQAAIGIEQLKKLSKMNDLRRKRANLLLKLLSKNNEIKLPYNDPNVFHIYQMFTVKVAPEIRDQLIFALRERGVGASVHFDPPCHLQPYYADKKFRKGPLEVTEKLSRSIITLPMFPSITEKEIRYMAEAILTSLSELL